jgi:ketosteroid isomerase-like protein
MYQSPESFTNELVNFYEYLKPIDLSRLDFFYADTASFKDPFNQVSGTSAIKNIFSHMFDTLVHPKFSVTHKINDSHQAFLCWDFSFSVKSTPKTIFNVRGSTHLLFEIDAQGFIKIMSHRDYWDPAEEIYEKIRGIGGFFRWIKKRSSAPP